MQPKANSEVTPVLSDEDTPASRPGWRTVVLLLGVGIAVMALVYATELKAFFGMATPT
jgi:hypothetical protein